MADLASTRVFGKLTVMHEAIVKANAEIVGDITASKFIGDGSQLTALPWGEVTGAPATATRWPAWGEVTGKPAQATRWPAWGEVTGKPSTFAPSAHTHSLAQITDAGNLAAINTNASTSNFLRGDGTWATPPNTNTTYAEITTAEIDAGTASTLRTITGRRMKYALDKKVDTTTQVIAGTGLSGGGTLASDRTLSVNYGTTAGTAAQGNDSRLSNSREWTASVVSQAEAEAGTATTARKWTAQRVRQAIAAYAAPSSRQIIAGTGLSGGGTLAANRTLSVNFATTAQAQALTADNVAITPKTLGDVLEDGVLTGAGAPIGSVRWEMSRSNIGAGYSPCDGHLLTRAAYPDAWAAIEAGKVPVISDAEWLADPAKRGAFSTGNGSTTFRLPDYNGKSSGSLGAVFQRGDGLLSAEQAGVIQRDALQGHAHESAYTGSRNRTAYSGDSNVSSRSDTLRLTTDALVTDGVNGTPRVASETRPLNVTGVWVVKLFGAVVNAGSADAAQLASDYASLAAALQTLDGQIDFTIIYPNGGSAASPANVSSNSRYIEANPFPGYRVVCVAEVKDSTAGWGEVSPGFAGSNATSHGVMAAQLNDGDIVVQTGFGPLYRHSGNVLNPFGSSGAVSSAPCRVKVWKIKGVIT